ncbi:MAG: amidohydrolase [Bacteroidales bacterium]|nr:amidohydrolase [Bacteroidales bacterium]
MKTIKLIVAIGILFIFQGCTSMEKVDLVVINAKVYTVNSSFETAESFAIKDGIFVEVGSKEAIISKYKAKKVLDLNNQFVYPGFIDAHAHFKGYGNGVQTEAALYETTSEASILSILKDFQEQRKNDWILGRGWDQNDWEVKAFPTKAGLDRLFPDTPVYLTRIDGHAAWVNSIALELANISSNTKIAGGEIVLENGEPTGVLIDNAMSLVRNLIPEPSLETSIRAIHAAEKNCFAVGLTGVTDAGLDLSEILLIDSLQKSNEIKMRVNAMMSPTQENFEHFIPNGPYVTDRLSVRSIKMYADGALGSRGACMLQPYSDDPNNYGLIVEDLAFYHAICKLALENNFQVATHAIGDSANRLMLNIYGEYLKQENDLRWRIEHAQIIAPEDFDLFKKYSVVPSVQPTHATSDMYWAEDRVGSDRIKGAYAYKDLLDQNAWIPLGTDFPIEKIDPLLTFYAGVVRKDLNAFPENGFQKENALSREETLKGMTIWAAQVAFEEKEKGSIEVGKFADFVVLNTDIMTCDENKIPSTSILYTVVGGEIVFEK